MASSSKPSNRLQELRKLKGWTQAQLASNSGTSRSAIAAIESNSLSPSVHAAIAISKALNCSVEEMFGESESSANVVRAWESRLPQLGSWRARIGKRIVEYPASSRPLLAAVADDGLDQLDRQKLAAKTLCVATCDPAAAIIASLFSQQTGIRVLVFSRTSRESLSMLRDGLVHICGIHLSNQDNPDGNREAANGALDESFQLLPVVKWQSGIALGRVQRIRSARSALTGRLEWIGREPGSGAYSTLEQLFGNRKLPQRTATSHTGVAEALRSGLADAGVCPRLVAEEHDLNFLSIQHEFYDLCFLEQNATDDRVQAYLKFLKSSTFRDTMRKLPGYVLAN